MASRPGSSLTSCVALGKLTPLSGPPVFLYGLISCLPILAGFLLGLKKENKSKHALEMTMLCKDSGGFCCSAELDPDKQQLWVPCLGWGIKDFLCSLLPYQDSFPGRDLGSGKIGLLGVTFNPPC